MNSHKTWSRAGSLAALLVVAAGCGPRPAPTAAPVEAQGTAPRPGEIGGTGTLESEQAVSLGFRVGGRVRELPVDQGDEVTAGQLLATLEADEAVRGMALAEAGHAVSLAAVDKAAADLAELEASLGLADKDLARTRELVDSGVVSRSVFDAAEARQAEVAARLQAARAARALAEGSAVQAQKNVAVRQVLVADQQLRSPIAGLIVKRHLEAGSVVAAGAPVFTLASTGKLWVRAWVDETALGALQEGQAARIQFRSEPSRSYRGRVDRIGRESDRQTRELLVDVEVLERPARLALGQRADVFLQTGPRP